MSHDPGRFDWESRRRPSASVGQRSQPLHPALAILIAWLMIEVFTSESPFGGLAVIALVLAAAISYLLRMVRRTRGT